MWNKPQAVCLRDASISPEKLLSVGNPGFLLPTSPRFCPVQIASCNILYPRSFFPDREYLARYQYRIRRNRSKQRTFHIATEGLVDKSALSLQAPRLLTAQPLLKSHLLWSRYRLVWYRPPSSWKSARHGQHLTDITSQRVCLTHALESSALTRNGLQNSDLKFPWAMCLRNTSRSKKE